MLVNPLDIFCEAATLDSTRQLELGEGQPGVSRLGVCGMSPSFVCYYSVVLAQYGRVRALQIRELLNKAPGVMMMPNHWYRI